MGTQQQQQQKEEGEEGSAGKRRKVAAAADVTMDLELLDCPVCYHPLRPPVFQCTVGNAICSSCHDKVLEKCHFCALPTVYNRCYMVEHVIESIKVACSNGNHGCTARITYYQKEDHEKGKHKWNLQKVVYSKAMRILIHIGSTVLVGEDGQLFLVNMILEPLGGVISVCNVQPHITGSKFKCKLTSSCSELSYSQAMEFQIRSTNLYDGLPKDCFLFLVPKVLLRGTGASTVTILGVTLTPQ